MVERVIFATGCGLLLSFPMTLAAVDSVRSLQFDGRLVTETSAPNDLGAFLGIALLLTSIFIIHRLAHVQISRVAVNSISIIAFIFSLWGLGVWLFMQTGTRAAIFSTLLTSLFMVTIAYLLRARRFVNVNGVARVTSVVLFLIFVIIATVSIRSCQGQSSACRLEVMPRFSELGIGDRARLEAIPVAMSLVIQRPFSGFGDQGYQTQVRSNDFENLENRNGKWLLSTNAGPHNELLARSLQSGLWGTTATIILLFGPFALLFTKLLKSHPSTGTNIQVWMGLAFSLNIIFLSFFLEPYSLKHTSTFNSLMLAVLFATVSDRPPARQKWRIRTDRKGRWRGVG
jgi:hypothetical protein